MGQPGRISSGYKPRSNLKTKVLDFVQLGGPKWTVDRTVFEMWLGVCKSVLGGRRYHLLEVVRQLVILSSQRLSLVVMDPALKNVGHDLSASPVTF